VAHSAIHFALGVAAGTALSAPALSRAFARSRKLAMPVLRWLLFSYALGLWAVVPSLLRHAGIPESFCGGWWMNLFLFHPLLARYHGGTVVASATLLACCAAQYALLLAAIRLQMRRRGPAAG
jgi:hypothetical protein